MFSGYSFWVDKPQWLLLLVLLIPTFVLALRSIGGLSRTKVVITFAARAIVIVLLALALAEPNWARRGQGLTAMILIDRSDSIPLGLKQTSLQFLRKAAELHKKPQDCVGVIEIGKDATITAMPDPTSAIPSPRDAGDLRATNLAAGVRLAAAVMRADTANRIILASDGNETDESVLKAAELAQANKVPIDVLVLEYEHDNEVVFDQLVAPARARFGTPITVKMVLRTYGRSSGDLSLRLNGQMLDINGEQPGSALHVNLEGGTKMIPVTLTLDHPGPHRFEASYAPDAGGDQILQNNRQVAITFVASEGRVLVIDDSEGQSAYLTAALRQSNIASDRMSPEQLGGLVELMGYDAVVLANVPRVAFQDEQDRALESYVFNAGGGLIMLGGAQSFGAGSWIGSQVAKALPIKLDPPAMQQMPRGALVIIMHSCEMPQGNYWGEQIAIKAIEALSSQDYIGVVDYDWGRANGYNWVVPLSLAGDKTAAIAAAKKMQNGDMPDFGTPMQMTLTALTSIRAGKKHAIIITDGDPQAPSTALLNQYAAANVACSTVMIAGHGTVIDASKLANIANKTGGTDWGEVKNPKNLPQIIIKEAQMVSRSLIVDGDTFQPSVVRGLPGPVEGFSAVPAIDGYVLTAARESGLAQVPMVITGTLEGQPVSDPLYAYWNHGVGKSIAYTSDLTGLWGSRWVNWEDFRAFWEKSLRWVMRPSSPVNFQVTTQMEGDTAYVDVEALQGDASFLNYLQTSAIVLDPESRSAPLELQQIGPGHYRAQFKTGGEGAYLVNIKYASAPATPGGQPVQGNIQAAVAVPYSAEFRAIKHNRALLEELARRTGGRVIKAIDPELADLFNRDNLEVPRSPRRIWDLLAILAAALFVFDVAARRLSVDGAALAAWLRRSMGQRGEAGADTMAAWKKARAQVAHRREDAPKSAVEQADRTVKFEADETSSSMAIDVGADGPEASDRPATPQRRDPAAQPQVEEEDYTSRLLKAKRRARPAGDGGGGPSDRQAPKGGGDA